VVQDLLEGLAVEERLLISTPASAAIVSATSRCDW
jgi:hypothetical protein